MSRIGEQPDLPGDELRAMLRRLHQALTEVVQVLPEDPFPEAVPAGTTRSGVRKIIARHLAEKVGKDGVFTITDLEKEVTAQTGKHRTETDRRLRELREVRWVIGSYKTDPALLPDQLRLVHIGDMIWHKNYRWPTGLKPTNALRQLVFKRDNYTCQRPDCGIKAGEEYPREPGSRARMTLGRILPGSRGGRYTLDNCRAECSRCNEESQDRYDYGQDST